MANWLKKAGQFLFGQPEEMKQVSTLTPEQQGLFSQLQAALSGQGAGGAFGQSADYYRDLLDPSSQSAQMFEAPMMRQFNQDIVPGLAEQFAGMGSGALSGSGFRNASLQAGTDLSERIAAMRAGLRQQGAQGLAGLGSQGLAPVQENIMRPRTGGLIGDFMTAAAPGIGMAGTAGLMGGFNPFTQQAKKPYNPQGMQSNMGLSGLFGGGMAGMGGGR